MRFFWVQKKFASLFSFKRNSQKTKKTQILAHFWLPHQQMGSMAGTFPMPDFNSSHTITHRNFVRIGDKKFSRKYHEPLPTFYQICTRKKHLNGRSSLIKHNMTMNYTPLDSSFQCVSFESKKNLPRFFRLSEIHKKPKKLIFWHIFGSHTNKWGLWPELSLCLTSTHPIQ
jgi:hypothetical protein